MNAVGCLVLMMARLRAAAGAVYRNGHRPGFDPLQVLPRKMPGASLLLRG